MAFQVHKNILTAHVIYSFHHYYYNKFDVLKIAHLLLQFSDIMVRYNSSLILKLFEKIIVKIHPVTGSSCHYSQMVLLSLNKYTDLLVCTDIISLQIFCDVTLPK